MQLNEQIDFYNKYWKDLNKFGSYKIKRISEIIRLLDKVQKKIKKPKILDLGCGDGRCCAIWNEIGDTTGVDLSVSAMEIAKKRYPHISFLNGNAVNTNFEDESFDVIITQEVIEHIEVQEDFVAECFRLLRKNGFMILTTPNKYYFDRVKGGNYSNQPIEQILTPTELKNLLKEKFKIHEFYSIIFPKGDYGIYNFLGNSFVNKVISGLRLYQVRNRLMSKNNLGVNQILLLEKK